MYKTLSVQSASDLFQKAEQEMDSVKKEELYRKAGELGHKKAKEKAKTLQKHIFNNKYDSGETELALKYAELAAENGVKTAMYTAGVLHLQAKHYDRAFCWISMAANPPILDTDAQVTLGLLYQNGEGTEVDSNQAAYWYYKALINKHRVKHHEEGTHNNPETLLIRLAQGNINAQLKLGHYYLKQRSIEMKSQSMQWFQKAAEQHNPEGLFYLAYLHEKGYGVKKDSEKAYNLYLQSIYHSYGVPKSDTTYNEAMNKVIELISEDILKTQSEEMKLESITFFKEAAKQHNPEGLFCLAYIYENDPKYLMAEGAYNLYLKSIYHSYGVPENKEIYEKSVNKVIALISEEWVNEEAEAENAEALVLLGLMFEHGLGGRTQDSKTAKEKFLTASGLDTKNEDAQEFAFKKMSELSTPPGGE